MHELLKKLLHKRGITDTSKMDDAEKASFDNWNEKLKGEMTVEKITEFCNNQVSLIENLWKNTDNSTQKNERLIIQHSIYKSIIDLTEKHNLERENTIKYLTSLVNG